MKENQRAMLSKMLLKEALIRLLREKKLEHISIKELCEEAGINRATFYRHYELPRSVLEEIKSDLIREVRAEIETAEKERDLRTIVRSVCRYLYEHRDTVTVFLRDDPVFDLETLNDMLLGVIHENTLFSFPTNVMADPRDKKLLGAFMVGGGYNMTRQWLLGGEHRGPDEMADVVLSFARLLFQKK